MKKGKYLISLKALEKKSKASLLRLIMKHLKTKSKKSLARLAYSMIKSKLPRLKKGFIELDVERYTKTGGKEIKWYPKGKLVDFIMFLTNELVKRGLLEHLQQVKKRKGIIYPSKRKTKRKFSPKQLAAQRLFAKRARAGTLRKRR